MNEATERPLSATPAAPTLSGQVSRAMLWNAALQPARLAAGFVSGAVVANVLTRDAYGTIAVLSAMASLLGLIDDIGVERGLVKFLPEIEARHGREGVRRTLQLVIAQKLLVLVLIVAGALAFRERFFSFWQGRVQNPNDPSLLGLLDEYRWVFFGGLMALVVFGALFDIYMQVLASYFRQRASNSIAVVTTLLKPILLIAVLLVGWGVLGVIGTMVAIPIVATGLAAWQAATVRRALADRPTQAAVGARLPSRFVKYSALSFWVQATEYAYSTDVVVLILSSTSLALSGGFKYAAALVAQLLTALWSPLTGIQIPLFARLYTRGDDRQLGEAFAILCKFLAAVMIPAAVGLALLAPNLVPLIGGAKYVEFGPVAQILALFLCLDAALGVPRSVLQAYERYRPILIARTIALVALPLLLLVAPQSGAIGAAIVIGVVRLGTGALVMALALRSLPLRYPAAFAGRVTLASLAMAAVVAPLALGPLAAPADPERLARIVFLVATLALGGLGGAVYLAAFRLTGGLDPADRRRIGELRLPLAGTLLRFL